MKETALGIKYPESGDASTFTGDLKRVAEAVDPLLQAGGVSKSIYIPGEVTRTGSANGSFSTPIKIELPRVKEKQLIEIRISGYVKASVETAGASGGTMDLKVGTFANQINTTLKAINNSSNLAANVFAPFGSTLGIIGPGPSPATPGHFWSSSVGAIHFLAEAEMKPCVIELIGGCTSGGTITAFQTTLSARAIG